MIMIAASLAAAAPAAPAQPIDAHAQHMQMEGHEQHHAELLAFRRTSARTVSTSQGGTLFRKEAEDVLPEGEARHLRRLRETYRRQGTPVRR